MKIQCDVCNKDEATMYCVADEAALCSACDHRVHHANKLAGKHQRFSLLSPSSKDTPLCDICQEKRAFLFCQQDRAILCRDCDLSIHKANEHIQKHNRFLLTGVKLSAKSALYSSSSSTESPASSSATSLSNGSDAVPTFKKPVTISRSNTNLCIPSAGKTPTAAIGITAAESQSGISQLIGGSTSSISEYLMETLPGWHVEDFLDFSAPNGFSKNNENEVLPFWEAALEKNLQSFSSAERTSLWVPQVPPPPPLLATQIQAYPSSGIAFGAQIGFKESKDVTNMKPSRKWKDENSFAVPQICPSSAAFKRSRSLWE